MAAVGRTIQFGCLAKGRFVEMALERGWGQNAKGLESKQRNVDLTCGLMVFNWVLQRSP